MVLRFFIHDSLARDLCSFDSDCQAINFFLKETIVKFSDENSGARC